MGAGASGIWEHREETKRPLHETMRLAEAWLMRHALGGSMPSQTLTHCKIQSRKDAPKMAILEAPCAQNAPGRSTMRLPEALLPRTPTWESSHFWGLAKKGCSRGVEVFFVLFGEILCLLWALVGCRFCVVLCLLLID